MAMTDARLDSWLKFIGTIICASIVALTGNVINNKIQEKRLELQKMKEFGQYIEYALDSNIATRRNLANYFISVTEDKELKRRWNAFLILVENEYVLIEKEKQEKEEMLKNSDLKDDEKQKLELRIQELEKELKVRPNVSELIKPVPGAFGIEPFGQKAFGTGPFGGGAFGGVGASGSY